MKLVELARKLVGFNTVSQESSTRQIADFISEYCANVGFDIEQYPYKNGELEKVNIIARKGGENSKLCLSGHMDTVSFNESDWNTDPLKLTLLNGKYYGMGIADMKLFLAIAMKAGELIDERELKCPFSLCFTSDEEVGCLGVRKLMREGTFPGEMILIGEPTEMIPLNLHKGYMFVRIILRGKTGHASTPDRGKSVISLGLSSILQKIEEFRQALREIKDVRFEPSYPTINVGVVTTDTKNKKSSKNLIADFCKIELEIRPIPGQEAEELFFVFRKIISEVANSIDGIQIKVEFARAPTPPMETDVSFDISREIVRITGNGLQSECFNTEGGIFNQFGSASIICGPGSINQAHKAREFVSVKFLQQNIVDKYVQLIKNICC